ncbi:MAG TPA: type 4a pilus biogenesis protein PilO, partial [Candidatus Binatia bacterium]|nr:type 4a pilus biogenesis protein PilO [Candidatus Binatia bacterium]
MGNLISRILELPKHQQIGLLVGLILAILVVDFLYLYSPNSDRISSLSEEIEAARNERDKKKKLAANLPKLQQEIRNLDGMLKQAVAQLPDQKEVPNLLSSISNKARESGLEIIVFRPRAENFQDFYAEIPVDVVVRGGFHNVATFFDEVGRLDRLVNLGNINLKHYRVNEDNVTIQASTMATTFRFLNEGERKKVADEKA